MKIRDRVIGEGPCYVVGEVAQAHEGSVTLAHAYIDAIADAGADACKFQVHIAEAESTPDEPWRVEPRWKQDESRYAYWKRLQFSGDQWAEIAGHAWGRGLAFIVSPFSVEAVELMKPLADAWKVASGEVTNADLLVAIAATGGPVIVSSGMSTYQELEDVRLLFGFKAGVAILQCTTSYPTKAEDVGLGTMLQIGRLYRCPMGLSDHSGTIFAGLGAAALGADIIEAHVTLSKDAQGFDTSSSITPAELKTLVDGVKFLETARWRVDKDAMAEELAEMRSVFLDKHKRRASLV